MISCLVQEGSSSGNIKVPESCSLQSLILVELLARFLLTLSVDFSTGTSQLRCVCVSVCLSHSLVVVAGSALR